MRRPNETDVFRLTVLCACGWCVVPLGGCAGGEDAEDRGASDYDDVLAACGTEAEMVPAALGVAAVSSHCASRVGAAIRIDWSSFPAEPHAFSTPESADELVIAGALVAILSDASAVSEGLDESSGELRRHLDVSSTSSGKPGVLWLSWFQDRVTRIAFVGDDPSDWDMLYSAGVISVGDIADVVPPDDEAIWMAGLNAVPAAGVASELTHEASHAEYPGHVDCVDASFSRASCDPDENGAYGAGALWANAWFEAYSSTVGESICVDAFWFLYDTCRHINDHAGFTACEGLADSCE